MPDGPFPTAPPRTVHASLPAHGSLASQSEVIIKVTTMQLHVACAAQNQRFALTCHHVLFPGRELPPILAFQVCQLVDVMDLDPLIRSTHLAHVGPDPFF